MIERKYTEALLALLANQIANKPLPHELYDGLEIEKLISLSRYCGVAGIVCRALADSGASLSSSVSEKMKKILMSNVFSEAGQTAAAERVTEIFNRNEIRHIHLKGYVLRSLYPSPEMRTSCDLDVLISPDDVEKAKKALVSGGFTFLSEEEKDLHFTYPPAVHIELHRALSEAVYRDGSAFLADALERAVQADGYRYRQTDEDFYVYMIFHLAKHFILGGSGVRSVLDIYVYRNKIALDESDVFEKLTRLGLNSFERHVVALGRVWMGEADATELTERLTDFVLDAGVYGTEKNRVGLSIGGGEKKGRVRYFLSRAFPKRSVLLHRYPILKKLPVLLPFCWILRFFNVLRPGQKKRLQNEISLAGGMDRADSEKIVALYRDIGLYKVL